MTAAPRLSPYAVGLSTFATASGVRVSHDRQNPHCRLGSLNRAIAATVWLYPCVFERRPFTIAFARACARASAHGSAACPASHPAFASCSSHVRFSTARGCPCALGPSSRSAISSLPQAPLAAAHCQSHWALYPRRHCTRPGRNASRFLLEAH
jgi:hypothetical protein